MKKLTPILFMLTLGGIILAGNFSVSSNNTEVVIISNVNVIPMDCEHVSWNQTVEISNGLIRSINSSEQAETPPNARIIDGSGKYLLPGLIDLHTHICDPHDLALFLAHGVTTIRNMSDLPGWVKIIFGFPDVLSLRQKVRDGVIPGPEIYTAGEILDGASPTSPFNAVITNKKEAEKAVARQKKKGYDFIKIYDNLTPEAYQSILDAAQKFQIPVIGHVPKKISINEALTSGLVSIEYLTGYIDNDRATFVIPQGEIDEYVKRNQHTGIWNCPTLVIWDHVIPPDQFTKIANLPEMQHVSWRVKWLWMQTLKKVYQAEYEGPDYPAYMMEISKKMTGALHQARARLVLGTDTNFVGVFPGWAAQRELELLAEAGLTPFEAIKTGTSNAADCLNKLQEFGTVSVGKRADLILLDGNPLEDLKNIRRINGLVLRGKWFSQNDLQKLVKTKKLGRLN